MSNIGMDAPAAHPLGSCPGASPVSLPSPDSDQPSLWRSLFHPLGHPPAIPHAGVAFALTSSPLIHHD